MSGQLSIRNETAYPDAEVKALVRWACEPIALGGTFALVKLTRQTPRRRAATAQGLYYLNAYSGTAYNYLPGEVRAKAPAGARWHMRLSIGGPECWPMGRPAWRHGWGEAPGEWPSFLLASWQEALVALAAHEACHLEAYREGLGDSRNGELRCELFAAARLKAYREGLS